MARAVAAATLLMLILWIVEVPAANKGEVDVGYYDESCPMVEDIVRKEVEDAVSENSGLAPGLLRLHFHDCFVQGCDASILLDSIPKSAILAEKDHPANAMSLRGMDVIDKIKDCLEQVCPQTVSCADILAFAARDAVNLMGGPTWPVPGGRLDGLVSSAEEAGANLAAPTFNLQQLTQSFAAKGFSQEDMITLSGAHTIGDSHCSAFQNRLNTTHPYDARLDARLAASLQSRCSSGLNNNKQQEVVGMDAGSPRRFDVSYYVGVQQGRGLFSSDAALLSNPSTSHLVSKYARDQVFWFDSFADAMFRMSQIDVKTSDNINAPDGGEIRVNCHVVNNY